MRPLQHYCSHLFRLVFVGCTIQYNNAVLDGGLRSSTALQLSSLVCYDADIDECTTHIVGCGSKKNCINTEGSFKCVCKPGFTTGVAEQCTGQFATLLIVTQLYMHRDRFGLLQSTIPGVCQSISMSVTRLCRAKTARLIDVLFWVKTYWPKAHCVRRRSRFSTVIRCGLRYITLVTCLLISDSAVRSWKSTCTTRIDCWYCANMSFILNITIICLK